MKQRTVVSMIGAIVLIISAVSLFFKGDGDLLCAFLVKL